MLGRVALPPGARIVSGEPRGDGGLLARPGQSPAAENLVDVVRFAVAPGSATTDVDWMKAHPPAGSRAGGSGSSSTSAGPDEWFVAFSWPAVGQLLDSRTVAVSVAQLGDGLSGIRVDAQVTWLPAKPPGDIVPDGVTVLTAALSGLNPGEPPHAPTTTTSAALIAAIRAQLDALPVVAPGSGSCPAAFGHVLTLSFRDQAGAQPVAVVVASTSGCEVVQVFREGHLGEPSLDGYGFASLVEGELGWHGPG